MWNRIGRFFREVRQEYKATTWPTRKVLLSTTGVVAVILLVMGVYFGVLDLAFSSLTKFITTLLNIG
ncbi:MAG TPA: preprotein translocase subunit SecE [Thermotogota bacterium]|nr:preprotein translocase subunit SecE [Thermotogota bacterium]HRW93585.1 preprotein translocase subunit SecE [Thermotogota bacterium]